MLADLALKQEKISKLLRQLREKHALSQEQAAQKVGVTNRTWQRWEKREVMPRAGNLSKIAEAFAMPVQDFYEEEPQPDPQLDRIEAKIDAVVAALASAEQLRLNEDARQALRNLAARATRSAANDGETRPAPRPEPRRQGDSGE